MKINNKNILSRRDFLAGTGAFLLIGLLNGCTKTKYVNQTILSTQTLVSDHTMTRTVTQLVTTTLPEITKTITITENQTLITTIPIKTASSTNTTTPTTNEAKTLVGGIISTNTTWKKTDSPFLVTDTVQIPEGVTLTIEPGSIINKSANIDMFLLMGKLYAYGTSLDPITFNGGGNSTIVVTYPNYGEGDFKFCIFQNSRKLWDGSGKLYLRYSQIININYGSDKTIGDSCISFGNPTGDCNIEYNRFINCGGIMSYDNDYNINIKYNLFKNMVTPIWNAGGGTPKTKNIMNANFNSFIDSKGYILALDSAFSPTIDAKQNYWGTIDTSIIDQKIYDGHDDITIGSYITYQPILITPDPNAPTSE
jgi:hypothetical protein